MELPDKNVKIVIMIAYTYLKENINNKKQKKNKLVKLPYRKYLKL